MTDAAVANSVIAAPAYSELNWSMSTRYVQPLWSGECACSASNSSAGRRLKSKEIDVIPARCVRAEF